MIRLIITILFLVASCQRNISPLLDVSVEFSTVDVQEHGRALSFHVTSPRMTYELYGDSNIVVSQDSFMNCSCVFLDNGVRVSFDSSAYMKQTADFSLNYSGKGHVTLGNMRQDKVKAAVGLNEGDFVFTIDTSNLMCSVKGKIEMYKYSNTEKYTGFMCFNDYFRCTRKSGTPPQEDANQ